MSVTMEEPKPKFLNFFSRNTKTSHLLYLRKQGQVAHMKSEDLSEDDIIIAIMGPTGSGKSSFVNVATGNGNQTGVGHDLESFTSDIQLLKFQYFERSTQDIVFVDTPGFDDTHRSDVDVLNAIAAWLSNTYKRHVRLAGILYFHRISDNRMAGTPLKNLHMFEKLCGKEALRNIVLTTTMWDEVDMDVGIQRERELERNYWKTMLSHGSRSMRHLNTEESAWKIIDAIVSAQNEKYAVELQSELVDMGKELPETGAGRELYGKLQSLVARQQETLERLRASMKRQDNEIIVSALKDEYEGLRSQLATTVKEMESLKIPIRKRLRRFFSVPLGFFSLGRSRKV